MTERPRDFDGERPTVDLAPELDNSQQADAGQSQDVAADAMNHATSDGLHDTEKVRGGYDDADAQDLVDHMNQMVTSGRIDLSAFEGEPNHDDGDDEIMVNDPSRGWGNDPDADEQTDDLEAVLSSDDLGEPDLADE